MSLPVPLNGIVVPLITPLADQFTLDREALDRLIAHVVDGGVRAVFILGTTGEGPALSARLQREVVERTCRAASGRLPVLVGIANASLEDSLDLAHFAANRGAEAVVTTGPLYFPVAQEELLEYVRRLAADSPLPLFLYNMPSHSQVRFDPSTVAAASRWEKVIGLKDSSGQLMYLQEVRVAVAAQPGFSLLIGPEELMAQAVLFGVHGGVNGGANLFPGLYVSLHAAAVAGDLAAVQSLHARVIEVSRRIYRAGTYGSSYIRGLKCAASCLGLCRNVLAPPYTPFGPQETEAIRRHLTELGALPA